MSRGLELYNSFDAIVTLGLQLYDDGTPRPELLERVDNSVEIRRACLAAGSDPLMLMSGDHSGTALYIPPHPESRVMKNRGCLLGVSAIDIFEEPVSLCTWGNALFTKRIAEALGLRRLLLNSSAYHLVIGEIAFKHTFGPDYEIICADVPDAPLTPEQASYQAAALETAQIITARTAPGDHEAIAATLVEIMPVYEPLFAVPDLGYIHQARLQQEERLELAEAA